MLTVREAMKTGGLSKCRLLAGEAGLDNAITCVDCMEVPNIEPWLRSGELLITTGYALRDDENAIPYLLEALTKGKAAALTINTWGFAISQTVKQGYILRASEDLLDIMQRTTGKLPYVFPVNMQDITPYGNDVHHINSIMQPCTCTEAPVVGVAITTEMMVPGCGTGCSHMEDIEEAARFVLEVAKDFTAGKISFYDAQDDARMNKLYGSMKHLQQLGNRD